MPVIFHELRFCIRDSRKLEKDVNLRLQSLLNPVCGGDATQHVRHLHLEGFLSVVSSDGSGVILTPLDQVHRVASHEKKVQEFISKDLSKLLDQEFTFVDSCGMELDPLVTSEEDSAWGPVIDLMKALPNLTRLVYNCRNQFPPSLLDVLHSCHPQCRLYHHSFRFRSLTCNADRIDPHELAIATSPCLYSVKVICSMEDYERGQDQNAYAMLDLVAGLAPNLKEAFAVYLIFAVPHDTRQKWPGPWRGLPGFVSGKTGSLNVFSITGRVMMGQWPTETFSRWAACTDLSSLRHLTLGGGYDTMVRSHEIPQGFNAQKIGHLAQHCRFPRLKSFEFYSCGAISLTSPWIQTPTTSS